MFHLARSLGMTVGEMDERMSALEFAYWLEIYRQEAQEASGQEHKGRAQEMASAVIRKQKGGR